MERESRTKAQQIAHYGDRKIGFLREAVAEGADKIVPPGMTEEQWNRRKDIGKAYSYLTLTEKDLGKIYGRRESPLTRERIRQIHRSFLLNLYKNCSPELQDRFSLPDLFVRKPLPFRSKVILQVAQQVKQGINSRRQIARNTDLTPTQVTRAAGQLKQIGIEIPRTPTFAEELEERVKTAEDDKKLQEILDAITVITLVHYAQRNKGTKALTFLTNILKSDGLYLRNRELKFVAEAIRNVGIPIRIVETGYKIRKRDKEYRQSYIVAFTKHGSRILNAVRENPEIFERLSNSPVKLVAGPTPEHFPSIYEIRKTGKYMSVKSILIKHFGLRSSGGLQVRYSYLLDGCPVPIFRAINGHYCSIEKEEAIVDFMRGKLIRLGELNPV